MRRGGDGSEIWDTAQRAIAELSLTGESEAGPASVPGGSHMVQPEWRALLEKAVREQRNDHWFAYHEQRIAAAEGRPVGPEIRERVRRECPVPPELDFRMFEE